MAAKKESETTVERTSDSELVVTRTFNAPARLVFEAWTKLDLFKQWWVPKSIGISLVSCEADIRTGGTYRFVFAHPAAPEPIAFFGKYIEVTPHSRIIWSNEESPKGSVTTATFRDMGGKTEVVVRNLYPSKEALDAAIESGSTGAFHEQFAQLDVLIGTLS